MNVMDGIGWLSWWADADAVVRGVFGLLVVLSVVSWSVIAAKAVQLARMHRWEQGAGRHLAEGTRRPLDAVAALPARAPTRHLLAVLGSGSDRPAGREAIEARLGQAVREVRLELENGLTLLATIGNSAPFIGLFGTVWGIMHALQGLGGAEALSMDMVAGPVAEALVATAAGLFAAIPAVVGYNLLVRRLRRLHGLVEGNALRLADRAGSRVGA